jgi:hypothetical protein
MVAVLCPSPHLLAEQAAQNSKLSAAAVDAISLAAGVVVADIDEHQLQHAHTRHTLLRPSTLSATLLRLIDGISHPMQRPSNRAADCINAVLSEKASATC